MHSFFRQSNFGLCRITNYFRMFSRARPQPEVYVCVSCCFPHLLFKQKKILKTLNRRAEKEMKKVKKRGKKNNLLNVNLNSEHASAALIWLYNVHVQYIMTETSSLWCNWRLPHSSRTRPRLIRIMYKLGGGTIWANDVPARWMN